MTRTTPVEVANVGPAIPGDEIPRLFERFVRGVGQQPGDSERTIPAGPQRAGHAGLGLPIARAIVQANGGRIDVASDERGTRFTIFLPLLEAPDSQSVLSEQTTAPA